MIPFELSEQLGAFGASSVERQPYHRAALVGCRARFREVARFILSLFFHLRWDLSVTDGAFLGSAISCNREGGLEVGRLRGRRGREGPALGAERTRPRPPEGTSGHRVELRDRKCPAHTGNLPWWRAVLSPGTSVSPHPLPGAGRQLRPRWETPLAISP